MSEPVRRTGRTCEVRVHEQIRRNTGPAERVHPGSPETKPAEASSQRLGGFRIPHAAGKRLETPQNVLPSTRPGSNARMLIPETMVGRGAAPHRHRRNRSTGTADLPSFRRSPRAVRQGFAGRSVEAPAGSGRSLNNAPSIARRRASAHPTQISSANSSALIAIERTHKQKPDAARRNMSDRPAM